MNKHISDVNALDMYFGKFGGTLRIMPFFSNAPMAAYVGCRVR